MKRSIVFITPLFILLLLSLGILLSGCKGTTPEEIGSRYLSLWKEGHYQEAYALLSQKSMDTISQTDFVAKYQNIYKGIGLNSISYTVEKTVKEKNKTIIPFMADYTTSLAGKLSYRFQMQLVKEKGAWKIAWTPALIFPQMEQGDQVQVRTFTPLRGEIFDRNGEALALNQYIPTVWGNPAKITDPAAFSQELAPLLSMKPEDIQSILQSKETKRDNIAIFKAYLPDQMTQELEDKLLAIKGIGIDYKRFTKVRYYPHSSLLAHTLGYTGVISEKELSDLSREGYQQDQLIGKKGLEKAFESQLVGKKGYSINIVDSSKKKKETLASSPKEDGLDLHLTIDTTLQQKIEDALKTKLTKDQRGTVIVMDPSSGEILAMASAPTFDPNLFSFKISQEEWTALNDEKQKPLFNRVTQGLYPPGSTFKPFTAAMGLENSKITPDFVFNQPITNNQWKPTKESWPFPPITRVSHPAGPLDLKKAITWSDNIYFAYTALALGKDIFKDGAEKYGFGEAIPFNLGVSKSRLSNNGTLDSRKLLADSGYGQGEMLVTPLQMAFTFSAFANNGNIMKPVLVKSFHKASEDQDTTVKTAAAEVWKQNLIDPNTLSILLPDLKAVMSDPAGTGHAAYIPGMNVAAKTGTAEVGADKSREIAWFIGFTTDTAQSRLICITIESPANQGAAAKLAIAKAILPYMSQTQNQE